MVVNPRIVETGEERELGIEGCLSLGKARVHVEVERPRDIVIEAQDSAASRSGSSVLASTRGSCSTRPTISTAC